MPHETFVGTHLFPFSFLDEGVSGTLEHIKNWTASNAILLVAANRGEDIYPHGRRWDQEHRTITGKHEIVGGYYSTPHPELYAGTAIKPIKSPEEGVSGFDALKETIQAAKPLGLKIYAMLFEALYGNRPEGLYENTATGLAVDVLGRPAMQGCYNNPNYRNFMLAMVEDHVRHYDSAGIYIEFEGWGMQSPFYFLSMPGGKLPICFCDHCMAAARTLGWDGERARRGFLQLIESDYPSISEGGDGNVIEALRTILEFPEVIAWESMWMKTRRKMLLEIYGTAKSIRPDKEVGWNVNSPVQSMPFARAAFDYRRSHEFGDWIKPNIHNAFAAGMFDKVSGRISEGLLPDMDRGDVTRLLLSIFGYSPPEKADQMAIDRFRTQTRFGSQFVARETARVVRAVCGRIPVYSGLDVEAPDGKDKTRPGGMETSVNAALDAGANGIILGQFYHDWPRDSLEAVGRAVRARANTL